MQPSQTGFAEDQATFGRTSQERPSRPAKPVLLLPGRPLAGHGGEGSKYENRNPKQTPITETRMPQSPPPKPVSEFGVSGFRACFGFRHSSFGFEAPAFPVTGRFENPDDPRDTALASEMLLVVDAGVAAHAVL